MGTELAAMSIPSAAKQASSESSMYRQGSGWIVSTWDPKVRCNRLSQELAYGYARCTLAAWRVERAVALAGGGFEQVTADPGSGTVRDRVEACMATMRRKAAEGAAARAVEADRIRA